MVTGLESVFKLSENNNFEEDCIISMMTTSKTFIPYLFLENYNSIEEIPENVKKYLLENKQKLIDRKIKSFDETNWWKYGAVRNLLIMQSNTPRIFGLMKTRDSNPFWLGSPNSYFSGGVFALFPKKGINLDLNNVVTYLNSDEFKKILSESNMYSNNKVSFTPSAFSSLPFGI
jgi:hypothetical protein